MTVPPSPYPASAPDPHGSGSFEPVGGSEPVGAYGRPGPGPQDGAGPQDGGGQPSQPPLTGATPPPPTPGRDLSTDLGAALRFAGSALLRHWVPFLVAGLVYCLIAAVLVIGGVVGGIAAMIPMLSEVGPGEEPPPEAILLFFAISYGAVLLSAPFFLLWQSGSARSAEVILEGGRPRLGQALVGPLRIILTSLLVGAITVVGMLLLYVPGLIASVLLIFAVPAAARGASPIAAVKESIALVRSNLATAIVTWVVIGVIGSIAGTLIVTIVALVPFLLLFEVGMYERLRGRELPVFPKG